jgi:H+-transporting ATPase
MVGVTLGVCLLAFCSGVLAVGRFWMNLGTEALRTLAFVVLVFGSQATIYAIRERRHLWGSRPSLLLAVSSIADIAIASTLAVAGIAMTSLSVLLVVGTLAAALIFAFILDLVKVPVFARFGIAQGPRHHPVAPVTGATAHTKDRPKTEPDAGQPQVSDPKPEAIVGLDATGKAEPKPEVEAKPPVDLTARVAKRAYALYEEGGRKDGVAVQNWQRAESEIRKDLAKAEPPGETKAETKPEAKDQPQSIAKTEPQPEAKAESSSDVPPKLVKRVHDLYEELGREDVRAVEDWDKAQRKIRKEQPAP